MRQTSSHLLPALAAAVLFLFAATGSAQTTFDSPELGFTLNIPEGWKPIPQEKLEKSAHNSNLGQDGGVLGGFAKTSSSNGSLTPPYIVIDGWVPDIDLSRATWSTLESRLGLTPIEDARSQGLLDSADNYSGKDFSPSVLDKDRKLILLQGQTEGKDGKPGLYVITASFLGSDAFARVHVYLPADKAKSLRPEVNAMLASFHFDPGAAFTPYKETSRPVRFGRRRGFYGLGGFGFIGLIAWFVLRKWADD